jgi:Flp pilus assembly protein TadG
MIRTTQTNRRRAGATTVEVAVVLSVFLMFLFGVFEYCRYLLMLHVTTNAARDAARYAVVNVDKGSTFNTTNAADGSLSILGFVDQRMAAVSQMFNNYQRTVFACDMTQLNAATPVVAVKPGAWNEAQFGERIAVRITGDYKTALPNLLLMTNTIPVNVVVTMGSEG